MRVGNEKNTPAVQLNGSDSKPSDATKDRARDLAESREVSPDPVAKRGFEPSMESSLQRVRLANFAGLPIQALPFAVPAQIHAAFPAAGLKTPKAEVTAKLAEELRAARKAAESGDEKDRKAVDVVLRKVADAYGIGQSHVSGLEFDPRLEEQGGTIGTPGKPRTFIVIGKSALESPEVLASTILHESSHVQRNQQLADAGIDRDKLSVQAEAVWSALIEVEGYQNEIDNAKKLGTSESYVKGARGLREGYLRGLETAGGKEWRELAEKGKFQELHKKFIQRQRP